MRIWVLGWVCLLLASCQTRTSTPAEERLAFSGDSAYAYIAQQVAFGSRVPGSLAHQECGDWLTREMARHGAQVKNQYGQMTNYAGHMQDIRNIVAYFEGSTPTTILLCAHWDCRPWSDEEEEYAHRFVPVTGANDGASGVGVILEILRQLNIRRAQGQFVPSVQVVLFDCEDMGTPTHYTGKEREDTWCLGSQFWAKEYYLQSKNSKTPTINCQYGILLDMVGDPSATFHREYFSAQYAGRYLEQIWHIAHKLGYGKYFTQQAVYPITDDHLYVNTIAHIPCIDIIDYKVSSETGFADWWHTQRDDMRNINKQTLQAVGETVITTICSR